MVDLLLVNARGTRFRLPYSTVDSIPFSRLAVIKQTLINWKSSQDGDEKQAHLTRLKSLCDSFDPETNEFYFNANPNIVKILLKFYVGKKDDQKARTSLGNLCPFHIEDELVKYWGIKEFDELLDQGCMVSFDRKRHSIQEKIDERYAIIEEVTHKEDFGTRCFPRQREIIWNIMESPASSIYAKIYATISFSVQILAIFDLVLRTLPEFQPPPVSDDQTSAPVNNPFYIIEIFVISFFTLELFILFLVSPNKLKFILSPYTICDLLSIIPFYVYLALPNVDIVLLLKDCARIFRVMTVVKVFSKFYALSSILDTLRQSVVDLLVFIAYLLFTMLVFSALIYEFEFNMYNGNKDVFNSIPASFWFTIETMTTLGYGDTIPMSVPGQVIGGLCALCGIIIVAMPVGLLASNFNDVYQLNKTKSKVFKAYQRKVNKKA